MPLSKTEIPDKILQVFHAGVTDFLNQEDPIRERVKDATLFAIRTFTLGLDEIRRGQKPYKVVPVGWRIVAMRQNDFLLSVDITQRGEQIRVASISSDPKSATLLDGLRTVERVAAEAHQPLVLSLLRIPGVLIDAFVLTAQEGGEDLIVPIRGPAQAIERLRPYKADEFFGRIAQPTDAHREQPSLLDRFLKFNEVERPKSNQLPRQR